MFAFMKKMKSLLPANSTLAGRDQKVAVPEKHFVNGNRFRVAVFKQRGKIGMVLRRIPNEFLSFEQLGIIHER